MRSRSCLQPSLLFKPALVYHIAGWTGSIGKISRELLIDWFPSLADPGFGDARSMALGEVYPWTVEGA